MSESNKSVETKKSAEQVEREQMTRRQALRKFGFGAGLSAIMLLGVDDLARMVGARMEQMAGDSKVAEQIAKELQGSGVALASPVGSGDPCQDCWNHYVCSYRACDCLFPTDPPNAHTPCKKEADDAYRNCKTSHCVGDNPNYTVEVACADCLKTEPD